jgi:para-nitrobenzyl esterase
MTKIVAPHDSRRHFLRAAVCMAAGAVAAPPLARAQGGQEEVVETTHGRIRGVTIDGIHWFRGIPYGADTGGKNRFLPPQNVAHWSGVRDCTN